MELHESLRQLARDHGESLFTEADAFRGALDDYLDEGSASTGTINLLTDAVRLGALQGMISMLDSGAGVEDAVESAGQRLSRDRGSADVVGSQWACAVLGYALGRVPEDLATRLRPDALTAEPPGRSTAPRPHQPAPPPSPQPPPTQVSPAQQWPAPPPVSPQQPAAHPAGVYGSQGSPYGFSAGPAYAAPAPKKSRTGLIIGAVAAVLVLGVVAVIAIVALNGDDGDGGDEDPTTDPALVMEGNGYRYTFPDEEWQDLTDDTEDTTGTIDTIAGPGETIAQAQGNILVETSSARGETDVNNLDEQWKSVLEQTTGATPVDLEPMEIDGETALGVELKWTNDNSFQVHQIAYLVISGDQQYSITGSFREGDAEFQQTFYDVLDTWEWED